MGWRGFSWITVIIAAGGVTAAFGADSVQNEHPTSGNTDDPYLWLEDIHGAKPLAWVNEQNAKSRAVLQADLGLSEGLRRHSQGARCDRPHPLWRA